MPNLNGLWASLVLIGVLGGIMLVLGLGAGLLISAMYRVSFSRDRSE